MYNAPAQPPQAMRRGSRNGTKREGFFMSQHASGQTAGSIRLLERVPGFRKLLQYSFMFFLLKGLLWTAVLVYPLIKALANF